MTGGTLRKLVGLAALAAIAAAVLRRLRGGPAPQFSNHPTVAGGPDFRTPDVEAQTVAASTPPSAPVAKPPVEPTAPAPLDETADRPDAGPAAGPVATLDQPAAPSWVEPLDGACPDGYPIKAKLSSGIFHQPGGFSYERTKPDRCYATATDAEGDGLRPAKR